MCCYVSVSTQVECRTKLFFFKWSQMGYRERTSHWLGDGVQVMLHTVVHVCTGICVHASTCVCVCVCLPKVYMHVSRL